MAITRTTTDEARRERRRTATVPVSEAESYWSISRRPLHVLVFLLPLIFLYEIGAAMYLAGAGQSTIAAHKLVAELFEAFGMASFHIPAIALVTVLFIWHLVRRDRWTLHWTVLAGMAFESLLWALPLVVLGLLMPSGPALQATIEESEMAKLVVSIGAGLYEELVFRLIAIALIHLVLVDLFRMSNRGGTILAVVISAVAFALYHDVTTGSGALLVGLATFYVLAGCYFGVIFITRGFGVVVAVHALYDVIALTLPGS